LVQWWAEETKLSPGSGHGNGSVARANHDIGALEGIPNGIGVNEIFLALDEPLTRSGKLFS